MKLTEGPMDKRAGVLGVELATLLLPPAAAPAEAAEAALLPVAFRFSGDAMRDSGAGTSLGISVGDDFGSGAVCEKEERGGGL